MDIEIRMNCIYLKSKKGRTFRIDESNGVFRIIVPENRIMYGTEDGNNNAAYIHLIK